MNSANVLTLPFLGQRKYLHGTTLFDVLRPRLRGGENIRFKLARMINSDRVLIEQLSGPADRGRYAATITWTTSGVDRWLGVTPQEPSSLPRREPFDEQEIGSRARFEGSHVTLDDHRLESLVRSAVALNKALLFRVLTPPLPGQWLFTRLELMRDVEEFQQVTVSYRGNVGFAAVSSALEVDGQPAGTVMFSWLKR